MYAHLEAPVSVKGLRTTTSEAQVVARVAYVLSTYHAQHSGTRPAHPVAAGHRSLAHQTPPPAPPAPPVEPVEPAPPPPPPLLP
jgi:hypothetical protein